MIWMQSLEGHARDLIDPRPEAVDFREIAEVLARINRYAGNAVKPVSVGLHTLIVCDAVDEHLKPYALLHDAHEARTGDTIRPVDAALVHLAERKFGAGWQMRWALDELKRRHDLAIHLAAGLPMPSIAQASAIGMADLVALQTERRDFMAPCEIPWEIDEAAIAPLKRVYRLRALTDVADDLFDRFRRYLPALRIDARPCFEAV